MPNSQMALDPHCSCHLEKLSIFTLMTSHVNIRKQLKKPSMFHELLQTTHQVHFRLVDLLGRQNFSIDCPQAARLFMEVRKF